MPAPLVGRAMASRTNRSPAGKRASQAYWPGRLTVTQQTRARWLFGGHPGPLRDYFASVAGRSGQTASAMLDALTMEEGLLVRTLKLARRVPDSVTWLAPGRLRRLSLRQLIR